MQQFGLWATCAAAQPLQDIAVKLRIPQRKPWSGMAQSLDAAARAAADQEAMLVGVLPAYRDQAEEMVAEIQQGLDRWMDYSASCLPGVWTLRGLQCRSDTPMSDRNGTTCCASCTGRPEFVIGAMARGFQGAQPHACQLLPASPAIEGALGMRRGGPDWHCRPCNPPSCRGVVHPTEAH